MQDKTVVVLSTLVDSTIREYSQDTEFLIFRNPVELGKYLETTPIRATVMFVTEDTLGQTNSTLSYIRDLTENNTYLAVDKIVFVLSDNSTQHKAVNYLTEQYEIKNWEIILGSMTKAYVTEVINGTYRTDKFNVKHKAVYRIPRGDYVRDELKHHDTLQEDYPDDDTDLMDIPDEEVPAPVIPERASELKKCYVAGYDCEERTAFAFLAAQYMALKGKTIIVESDVDYHLLTEYATKSGVDMYLLTISDLYADVSKALNNIRKSDKQLIVVGAIDRVDFSYRFIVDFLFFNLRKDVDYMVCEVGFDDIPYNKPFAMVVPSTMKGILTVSENLDRLFYKYARYIGVNLKYLPQVHINSGAAVSTLLRDLLSDNSILCPVITISSLKLMGSAYDLGSVLMGGDF